MKEYVLPLYCLEMRKKYYCNISKRCHFFCLLQHLQRSKKIVTQQYTSYIMKYTTAIIALSLGSSVTASRPSLTVSDITRMKS